MKYPLVFSFGHLVAGNGFVARVSIHGAALLLEEDGQIVAYGVRPGAVAAGGPTIREAYRELRDSIRNVLVDEAALADSFGAFEAGVRTFYDDVDEETAAEFEAARAEVRRGNVPCDLPLDSSPQFCVHIDALGVKPGPVEVQPMEPAIVTANQNPHEGPVSVAA